MKTINCRGIDLQTEKDIHISPIWGIKSNRQHPHSTHYDEDFCNGLWIGLSVISLNWYLINFPECIP